MKSAARQDHKKLYLQSQQTIASQEQLIAHLQQQLSGAVAIQQQQYTMQAQISEEHQQQQTLQQRGRLMHENNRVTVMSSSGSSCVSIGNRKPSTSRFTRCFRNRSIFLFAFQSISYPPYQLANTKIKERDR